MGSISIRKWIRWLPDEPGEPTSTIVLTSPGRRFVDLRISNVGKELDWAIAGTSSSAPHPSLPDTFTARWEHWIDSRNSPGETATNTVRADGTTLEAGRMLNPSTGLEQDYEELWYDPPSSPEVLVLVRDGDERGLVIRVGRWCQGIVVAGHGLTAERWCLEQRWERVARFGDAMLPCDMALAKNWRVGGEIPCGGITWTVVESSQ